MATDTGTLSLLRLMAWLSPAFPVGGFAYSAGLESALARGQIASTGDLLAWLETSLEQGTIWNDAVLLAEAWNARADANRLAATFELASALAGSAERHLETTQQGQAFLAAASAWPASLPPLPEDMPLAYSVATGAIAAAHDIGLAETLAAYLHAVLSQMISASIRLSVLGQKQGVALLARLEPRIIAVAERAARSRLDDLGSATVMADVMSMIHETQPSRIFRS